MIYDFNSQLNKGKQGESILDKTFSDKFVIYPVTLETERTYGYDRVFLNKYKEEILLVEYKTDYQAHKTGNAFIETCSVYMNKECKATGWAFKSSADYLFYFIVEDRLIYVITMDSIKINLSSWIDEFPQRPSQNNGYKTYGTLVPLDVFEQYSEEIISI